MNFTRRAAEPTVEEFKTISRRFLAMVVDGLILLIFVYLESFFLTDEMPASIVIAGLIIYYFCGHFYYIYLHAVYGQTLGKMALKVKVIDVSGASINFRQAALRDSLTILFSTFFLSSEIYQVATAGITEDFRNSFFDQILLGLLTLWALAEIVVTLANKKRRSIHDFIAETVVVKLP